MKTKKRRPDKVESDGPLEDEAVEWTDEDIEIENRKPDLGEIEEDTSELGQEDDSGSS